MLELLRIMSDIVFYISLSVSVGALFVLLFTWYIVPPKE